VTTVESDERGQGTPQQEMKGGGILEPERDEREASGGAETEGAAAKEKQG
jgi:hypothetical protein